MHTDQHPTTTRAHPVDDHLERTWKAVATRSFLVLSTVSAGGSPHAAGVSYAATETALYVHTHAASRKARNVAANGRAAVVVPVRRLPVGPPFNVQFQAAATVLEVDDPEIRHLLAARALRAVTSHGELDEPDGCFLRLVPERRIHTYGIGVSLLGVVRDPLHAGARSVDLA